MESVLGRKFFLVTSHVEYQDYQGYRNFRPFTRTADYPHRLIFAKRRKKNQHITHTGG